jgi:nitrogen fixation protein NifU and related proteins
MHGAGMWMRACPVIIWSRAMAEEPDIQKRIEEAIRNPKNLGEMQDSDAIGTVGSPDCGDMLRMWVKFKEQDGKKVIDRATFQTFGCETAIAVASVATELIAGKTVEEALSLSGGDLSAPLGAAQMVEGALRSALAPQEKSAASTPQPAPHSPTLYDQMTASQNRERKVKVVLNPKK